MTHSGWWEGHSVCCLGNGLEDYKSKSEKPEEDYYVHHSSLEGGGSNDGEERMD